MFKNLNEDMNKSHNEDLENTHTLIWIVKTMHDIKVEFTNKINFLKKA